MTRRMPLNVRRLWKLGSGVVASGPVHVSMNDYWVHGRRDVPRVIAQGLRLRRAWPQTPGALGLWLAAYDRGHRQVSISIWRNPDDLRQFVHSPVHRRVMREFRDAGVLFTTAWTVQCFDRDLIWQQAEDRLMGRVAGIPHHRNSQTVH